MGETVFSKLFVTVNKTIPYSATVYCSVEVLLGKDILMPKYRNEVTVT
jgi:hypothetical protein